MNAWLWYQVKQMGRMRTYDGAGIRDCYAVQLLEEDAQDGIDHRLVCAMHIMRMKSESRSFPIIHCRVGVTSHSLQWDCYWVALKLVLVSSDDSHQFACRSTEPFIQLVDRQVEPTA